jgi:aspartyl-tRNA(Asn)/glutamyl-tRNA(Gln) amidotransferase subunit A
MAHPYELTLTEAAEAIKSKTLSPTELLESLLARVEQLEPKLTAWATLTPDLARQSAKQAEAEIASGGQRTPLHGIPFGAKDIFDTAGIRTAAGSKIWADRVPDEDSSPVAIVKRAGAVLMGKVHTTEFAAGDPAPAKNPWNVEHTAGGSSTGSGVAVAARMIPWAFGSQTVGSVLRPASYNGVVGLKPTFGRISRLGVIPHAQSFDHVGVLCRSVTDAATLLSVLAGYDANDPDCADAPVSDYVAAVRDPKPPRFGLVRAWFSEQSDAETRMMIEEVAQSLANAGAEVVEVDPGIDFGHAYEMHRTMQQTEIAHFHAPMFKDNEDLYGPKIAEYIRLGFEYKATDYVTAMNFRREMQAAAKSALDSVDVLLMPTVAAPPPKDLTQTGDTRFQSAWSFTSFPSITIPSALSGEGLPLGAQMAAGPFDEAKLLAAARWAEQALDVSLTPPL